MTEQPVTDERELSIATMEPTLRQQRLALAIIAMLSFGFVTIAPFAAKQVVQVAGFVPTVEAIIFVTSLTTAVLLFSQFSILGSRELLLLASGYLFAALIVIPHALSYPGAFAPKGLLGPGIQATADIRVRPRNVRFTPKSGPQLSALILCTTQLNSGLAHPSIAN